MKQFLEDSWFKIIITIAIIFVCISVSYYFFIYLPNKNSQKEYLANQIKCHEAGNELYQSQVKEAEGIGIYIMPEFKFDRNTRTCLYKGAYIGNQGYMSDFIIDVYTNKNVIVWDRDIKANTYSGSAEEFSKKEKELFGE